MSIFMDKDRYGELIDRKREENETVKMKLTDRVDGLNSARTFNVLLRFLRFNFYPIQKTNFSKDEIIYQYKFLRVDNAVCQNYFIFKL